MLLMPGVPLRAQTLGAGYQLARSNQYDMLTSGGPSVRLRFSPEVELRYDYLLTDFRRFENPCGFQAPSSCGPDTLDTSTRVHTLFVAARGRLISVGPVSLYGLPEIGLAVGTITKRQAATGLDFVSYDGILPGVGAALELSVSRVAGTPLGAWISARARLFAHPGAYIADAFDPFRGLDRIRSVEVGLTFAMR